MPISKKDVEHVANLARLELDEAEKEEFTRQLASILEYADKLKQLDTEKVNPTAHPLPVRNVFREDEVRPSLPIEEVLRNAPERSGNFFKVPKIMETES
ncbi:MAG TPA: Asp-tRNA(Asn)/Glu-tRNA(Gln) amidotransferase subunit GatC [Firmicutes bacterium]|nr:Asp-tRNA(Asn)/Glu-tRNA(Gln) amidotransferase subunit GatC [Bacillota bacterium]HHY98190.1 Asp-tRNA(Asn)/Glu-tRNA(Gln) amidotransferase subunit GatC [Bacillota bacterium]